jgi:hypothetical protein
MSSLAAARCRHIKVNGEQCGSPALRGKNFCFYHHENRPMPVECYYKADEYSTGEITLPYFEDAHSIQAVVRQVVQMVLQKRLEQKTAGLVLYALQIASSNLKRIEHEKPQPEQVVTDVAQETRFHPPMAARVEVEPTDAAPVEAGPAAEPPQNADVNEDLPPMTVTIQACYRSGSRTARSCGADTPVRVLTPPPRSSARW